MSTRDNLGDSLERMGERVVGQPAAIEQIVPYIHAYQAGLNPENRPVGVFMLLGPTGVGKTVTVEVVAEALHGSRSRLLRVDCAEYQQRHEVAKLIGAPPGYLGHRETQALFSQRNVNEVTSERCALSVILLDEIEKANEDLHAFFLGIFDKGTARMGDNTVTNFERSLIFMTSNVGSREMQDAAGSKWGLIKTVGNVGGRAEAAMRKKFSPEFANRVDEVIQYNPLTRENLRDILELQLGEYRGMVRRRMGPRSFHLEVLRGARESLLDMGCDGKSGARELKRVLGRHIFQKIAEMVATDQVPAGATVRVMSGMKVSVVMGTEMVAVGT